MINKKRLVKTFLQLVRIDSPSKKEKKAAEFLRHKLRSLGIRSKYDNAGKWIGGECGNIHAYIKSRLKNVPTVLINAHIDTVAHNGRIKPQIRAGVIRSDGSTILGADCKAGVAAIIEAITYLKENRFDLPNIKICFTVAEEIGLHGARHAPYEKIKADHGFVLDGGAVEKIINRAPSQINFEAKIFGRAAHAGVHPEKGINAIKVASEAITRMKIGRIDRETTANIGIIEGGSATNIVPEVVTIKGEARSHSKRKLKKQVHSVTKILTRTCKKYRAYLKMNVKPVYQSFKINEKSKEMSIVKAAVKILGIRPKIDMTGGGSDANIFNEMGIPSIILGVGSHNVHTSRESIAIEDLAKGTELLIEVIKEASEKY